MNPSSIDLLTCFYGIYSNKFEIQARSFDPNDNFNELDEYFRYIAPNLYGFYFSSFFYAVTNEEKKEVHIILVEQKAYIIKFDFPK